MLDLGHGSVESLEYWHVLGRDVRSITGSYCISKMSKTCSVHI